jgi:glycosyltransferase involved in cell wall biosynthesis
MAAWLAHASIYALPAFYEPFGLSVLEAAISGCALVLGDIPSLRENWEGAAIFVKPQDDTQLQHILCRLIADADARHTLAERAMERARQFSPLRFAFNYLEVYRRLCAIGRSVPCES